MTMTDNINEAAKREFDVLIANYPELQVCSDDILAAYDLLLDCVNSHGKILTCGNGGSAADATHIVGELMKGFKLPRRLSPLTRNIFTKDFGEQGTRLADCLQSAIPAIALTDQTAINTAVVNDNGADMQFAQQVYGYGRVGDVLIAISTSGNSVNVVNACMTAHVVGTRVISMTGENGGKMKELSDVTIRVPSHMTFRVQEYHLPVYHALCAMLEAALFG